MIFFFCRGLEGEKGIFVFNISSFFLNGYLFKFGVGKGVFIRKRKNEFILMLFWERSVEWGVWEYIV